MKEISRRQFLKYVGRAGLAAAAYALVGCEDKKAPPSSEPTKLVYTPTVTPEPSITSEPTPVPTKETTAKKEGIIQLNDSIQFEVQEWAELAHPRRREGWKYVEVTGRIRNIGTEPVKRMGERLGGFVAGAEYSFKVAADEFVYDTSFDILGPPEEEVLDRTIIPPGFSVKAIVEGEIPQIKNDYSLLATKGPIGPEIGRVVKDTKAILPAVDPEIKYQDIHQPLIIPDYATVSFIEAFTTLTKKNACGKWVPGCNPDVQETFISLNIQNNYGQDITPNFTRLVFALKDGRIAWGSANSLESDTAFRDRLGNIHGYSYQDANIHNAIAPGLTKRVDLLANYLEGSVLYDVSKDGVKGAGISKDDLQGALLAVFFPKYGTSDWWEAVPYIIWKLP